MEGPIISIDVSDRSSHYILFEKNNKKLGGVHKINHDVEGFDHLKKDIEMLSEKTGREYVLFMKQLVYILVRFKDFLKKITLNKDC